VIAKPKKKNRIFLLNIGKALIKSPRMGVAFQTKMHCTVPTNICGGADTKRSLPTMQRELHEMKGNAKNMSRSKDQRVLRRHQDLERYLKAKVLFPKVSCSVIRLGLA
jgi:hypothetical protein